jgi:GTP diphosphokinase / guanosine-3',5'-bis(diphosphate) 3'-diphosphatase
MSLVDKAIIFATNAFEGKVRKVRNTPTILHSLEVGCIVASMSDNLEVIAAGILHDVVEDANVSFETLKEEFGEYVAKLVASDTEDKRKDMPKDQSWYLRKKDTLDYIKNCKDMNEKIIILSDKLSNIRSISNDIDSYKGDNFFDCFNQKDPLMHYWYYDEIRKLLSDLKSYPAYQEYDSLVTKVFKRYLKEVD